MRSRRLVLDREVLTGLELASVTGGSPLTRTATICTPLAVTSVLHSECPTCEFACGR